MSCYHPIPAYKLRSGGISFRKECDGDRIDLPCGKCLGCRMRHARDWSVRVMHEAQMWKQNCFVTLTYAAESLPPGPFLEYRDFQLFMKRLRQASPGVVRFFMCGEYGPVNLRPHYHACLFNVAFSDMVHAGNSASGMAFYNSPTLSKLWPLGLATVQPLVSETASYCARYIVDKVVIDGRNHSGDEVIIDSDGVIRSRTPEFCRCSLKPGIGFDWFHRFGGDVYKGDFVVTEGMKSSPPKYYDKLKRRSKSLDMDFIEFERVKRAKLGLADNTDERLRVREVVHKARVSSLRREL